MTQRSMCVLRETAFSADITEPETLVLLDVW